MAGFLPTNPLEVVLRKFLTSEDGRVWPLLTPMAAAPVWIITKHYPELDGSDLVAPAGQNPELCVFRGPEGAILSLYTSEERARSAFAFFKLPPGDFAVVTAQGYPVLKWFWAVAEAEAGIVHFAVNFAVEDAVWHVDPDLIEILLERPAPPPLPAAPQELVDFQPAGNPEATLGPLRDFLARSPGVRAAWIFGAPPPSPGEPAPAKYDLALVMADPEDQSLVEPVNLILKAVTPLDEEWTAATLMADDESYRKMAAVRRPFYAAPGFLQG